MVLSRVDGKLKEIKEHPEIVQEHAKALQEELNDHTFGQLIEVRATAISPCLLSPPRL
eukprot:COSAG04_NODE_56_length_30604_cov_692.571119_13_plen_58_part_00